MYKKINPHTDMVILDRDLPHQLMENGPSWNDGAIVYDPKTNKILFGILHGNDVMNVDFYTHSFLHSDLILL